MSGYVPASLRRLVAQRAQGLCEYCLVHQDDTFLGCQVEHIVSEKHGGRSVESNLAYACVFCNRYKGSDVASISIRSAQLRSFFNPRGDRWRDHFRLDEAMIAPLTDVGEVTAAIMRLA